MADKQISQLPIATSVLDTDIVIVNKLVGGVLTTEQSPIKLLFNAAGGDLIDVNASGNLVVSGTSDLQGSVTLGSNLTITGNTTIGNTLTITGNTTIGNTLTITGNTTIGNTLTVQEFTATGNATLTGLTSSGNITVQSGSYFIGDGTQITGITVSATSNGINSATTVVNVAAASAPTVGQVLTATSGTTADWQSPLTTTYFNPVTWNGSTDRVLGISQHTSDSFTSATSMPLNIACGDGQIYEINLAGNFTPAAASAIDCTLNPNNTTYTSAFTSGFIYAILGSPPTSVLSVASSMVLDSSSGSVYSLLATVFTSTATKQASIRSRSAFTGSDYIMDTETHWDDTTTVWSSLGTIIMPNAWTGTITVKRIA